MSLDSTLKSPNSHPLISSRKIFKELKKLIDNHIEQYKEEHRLHVVEKKRPPFYDAGYCYVGLTECEVTCDCGAKWIQNFVEEGDKCIRELK